MGDQIILLVCLLAFFHKVDILEFFANNIDGDQSVRMLYQLGEENSTETRFQKNIEKYKTGGSLSKKRATLHMAQLREEMSD